jgi:hypothetical protein
LLDFKLQRSITYSREKKTFQPVSDFNVGLIKFPKSLINSNQEEAIVGDNKMEGNNQKLIVSPTHQDTTSDIYIHKEQSQEKPIDNDNKSEESSKNSNLSNNECQL